MRAVRTSLVLCALLAAGCQTLSPIPVPIRQAPLRSYPEPPPAMIRIPVVISLPVASLGLNPEPTPLTGDLKEEIPRLIKEVGGVTYQLTRDHLRWEVSHSGFSLFLRLHYGAAPQGLGGMVKADQKVLTGIRSILQWDPAWRLGSLAEPLTVTSKPLSEEPRKIDELISKTGEAYLYRQALQFNERLKALADLKPRASEIWGDIQEPIYLDKRIWLVIRPETVSVEAPSLDPLHFKTLNAVFEMTARPEILFGEEPRLDKRPLPPLIPFHKGPSGFHALSNVRISYPEAAKLLRDPRMGIVGQVISGTGDRKLRVKGLRFYGSGGKVVAVVELEYAPFPINLESKPARMTVYMVGTPRYNSSKRLFDLPDLDFDVKTSDFLVQVAEWIFKSDMRRMLRRKAKVPIGPKLDELSARLSQILNRPLGPHANLSVRKVSLKVLDSFADNDGMEARVALDGDTEMKVDWE